MTDNITTAEFLPCNKCHETKPASEFYSRTNGTKHRACKRCFLNRQAENRKSEEGRAKVNVWQAKNHSEAYLARNRRHAAKRNVLFPEKVLAKRMVRTAVERGVLTKRLSCEKCGDSGTMRDGRSKIQAHHDDYARPLDVIWLCVSCHNGLHRALAGQGE